MKEKVNFRWVENDDDIDKVDYNEFKSDYLNPSVTVRDIKSKYNISIKQYYRLKERVVEETGISRKPSLCGGVSTDINVKAHITLDSLSGKYRVQKYKDGILHQYGRYESLEEAMRVRDVMVDMNWDEEFYKSKIKPHYFAKRLQDTYEEVYGEFERDYMDGMPIKELLPKYGLSLGRYYQLSKSIKHKFGIDRKPTRVDV